MKTLITVILVGYLLVCSLFFIFQRSFLYFPQSASYVNAITTHFDNHGQILNGWVINPGQDSLLLYYGGNASAIEKNVEFFTHVAPQHTVYLIPYRGYGNNKGTPSEEALYSDALHIYDSLKRNYKKITIMGRSLGSGVATFVAANRDVNKLVLVTPYDSIQNVAQSYYPFLPVALLIKDKYLSVERVQKISAKTLIIIAERDEVIVRERSDALANQFDEKQLTHIIIAGADHNNLSKHDDYAVSVAEFLASD